VERHDRWAPEAASDGWVALLDVIRSAGGASIAAYVVVMSVTGFLLMGADKRAARQGAWRLPEKTLLMIALVGGSPGIWLGMRMFRHKTRHGLFCAGVPVMLAAQLLLLGWLLAG
jgi:uncharacterized membrane protein YsdA (DUF1294 family)